MKVAHDKQNIYFISDLHVGHENVLRFDNRPFEDVNEMHEVMIENWNSVVKKDDTVYFLGDLVFGSSQLAKWFIEQLNGKINIILGNHDKFKMIRDLNRFDNIYDYGVEVKILDESDSTKRNKGYQDIVLAHYPILEWNKKFHGAWHLHGHCHGNLMKSHPEYYTDNKVLDVGCNNIGYTPRSYSEIKQMILDKGL